MSEVLTISISEKLKKEFKSTCDSRGVKMAEVVRRGIIEQIKQLEA